MNTPTPNYTITEGYDSSQDTEIIRLREQGLSLLAINKTTGKSIKHIKTVLEAMNISPSPRGPQNRKEEIRAKAIQYLESQKGPVSSKQIATYFADHPGYCRYDACTFTIGTLLSVDPRVKTIKPSRSNLYTLQNSK